MIIGAKYYSNAETTCDYVCSIHHPRSDAVMMCVCLLCIGLSLQFYLETTSSVRHKVRSDKKGSQICCGKGHVTPLIIVIHEDTKEYVLVGITNPVMLCSTACMYRLEHDILAIVIIYHFLFQITWSKVRS